MNALPIVAAEVRSSCLCSGSQSRLSMFNGGGGGSDSGCPEMVSPRSVCREHFSSVLREQVAGYYSEYPIPDISFYQFAYDGHSGDFFRAGKLAPRIKRGRVSVPQIFITIPHVVFERTAVDQTCSVAVRQSVGEFLVSPCGGPLENSRAPQCCNIAVLQTFTNSLICIKRSLQPSRSSGPCVQVSRQIWPGQNSSWYLMDLL